MKIYTITLILILTLISPKTIICDFITGDGIKVQFFKNKSKKPILLKCCKLIGVSAELLMKVVINYNDGCQFLIPNTYCKPTEEL